ncbi:MAG: tetratricopeptide repeat protein, partial [Deltaproteobacteria bacterium]
MNKSWLTSNIENNVINLVLLCIFLTFFTSVLYWQVLSFDFIDYDDAKYVRDNFQIHSGITAESLSWAFTTFHAGFWQPLVWLSFMLDIEIFGLGPAGFHATNLIIHIINTLLLFLFLQNATRAIWKSWFVALFFALHPLHIESVAWIAERKDVLSTFFFMLILLSYKRYARMPSLKNYLPVMLFFILGLSTKAMLVSVPFLLLLMDYWPLNRFKGKPLWKKDQAHKDFGIMSLLKEKVPLFLITVFFCGLTIYTQKVGGAVVSQEIHPINMRIANAFVAYISYIGKMFFPVNLAVLYPFPKSISFINVIISIILLLLITVAAIKSLSSKPYFIIGWFWFIISIFPVIGLVQVGPQAMADRFTYIPLIGLFIICVWGGAALGVNLKIKNTVLWTISLFIIFIYAYISWIQISLWQNTFTLFSHTLRVTKDNYVAHALIGMHFSKHGQFVKAIGHLQKALEIAPGYKTAHNGFGITLGKMQRYKEAGFHFREALSIDPNFIIAHYNLGLSLYKQKKIDESATHFRKVLDLQPDHPKANFFLGNILAGQGQMAAAVFHFKKASSALPNDKKIKENLLRAESYLRK